MALSSRRVFSFSGYMCCLVQMFFNIYDARPLVLGLRFQDLILMLEVNSELCPLFWTKRLAKVVNHFELLTIFAERFVLHDWRSSESAYTHCNLLVFYWLFIIVIITIFIRSSYQLLVQTHHNNFSATLPVLVLKLLF